MMLTIASLADSSVEFTYFQSVSEKQRRETTHFEFWSIVPIAFACVFFLSDDSFLWQVFAESEGVS